MDFRIFPEVKKNFGFGCMRLPMNGGEVDAAQFCDMIDAFLDGGFNYFDTAHGYLAGKSETALRECLTSRYPRDRYILTNKLSSGYFETREEILPLFEAQLAACGVEYFDFYLMHAQDGAIYEKYKRCRAYETAFELKKQGRVRHVGISFHDTAEVLDRILTEYPQIEIVQIQFNYADYDDPSVQSRRVYEVCEKHKKPVIVMEPVKGGSLVNLPKEADAVFDALMPGRARPSNASYAIRFAASFPGIRMVLSGMSNMAQMRENIGFMQNFKPLSEAERAAVGKVCAIFRGMDIIPCTACHYCVLDNDCPQKIQIPELFSCLNARKRFESWNQEYYYENVLTRENGKASDCVKCGKCEKICPQHLPIRELLVRVAEAFEPAF